MASLPSVFFRFQISSTYAESGLAHARLANNDPHLIFQGQKVVIGQNCSRCMVIVLQMGVKHGYLSPTAHV